jgi:5-methylcytosine-specific restriction endonuclease McrA
MTAAVRTHADREVDPMAKRPWRTQGKCGPVMIRKPDGTVIVQKQTPQRRRSKSSYWRSKAWRRRRRAVLKRDSYACTSCGRKRGDDDPRLKRGTTILEVHHLTYERFGREELEDLLTLCQRCHANEHQWMKRRAA